MTRILLVDDDRQLRRALHITLRAAGYELGVASTGTEALARAATEPPDIVILDLGLPDADGREVCRMLRSGELAPLGDVPPRVLMLTARDGLEDRVGGLDDGADDYLVKPFSFAELAARVRGGAHGGLALPVPPGQPSVARGRVGR